MKKRNVLIKFILPVIILAAAIGYMSSSRVDSQEQTYYVELYCQVVQLPKTSSYRDTMLEIIDNGNNGYALNPKKFNPQAADNVFKTVSKLTDAQRSTLKDDADACSQLISEKMAE